MKAIIARTKLTDESATRDVTLTTFVAKKVATNLITFVKSTIPIAVNDFVLPKSLTKANKHI